MTFHEQLLQWFWSAMIFGSIAWYAALLLYVGYHGGREIRQMVKALTKPTTPGRDTELRE